MEISRKEEEKTKGWNKGTRNQVEQISSMLHVSPSSAVGFWNTHLSCIILKINSSTFFSPSRSVLLLYDMCTQSVCYVMTSSLLQIPLHHTRTRTDFYWKKNLACSTFSRLTYLNSESQKIRFFTFHFLIYLSFSAPTRIACNAMTNFFAIQYRTDSKRRMI